MQTTIATQTDSPTWDAYVLQHPQGNPYLLSAWGRAITSAYGHKDYRFTAVNESGDIVGLLPLVHIKHPLFGNTLYSMPYADLGGVIADDAKSATLLIVQASGIAFNNNIPAIELRQGADLPVNDATFVDSVAGINKVRMLLTLPDSPDALMAGFKAKLRSQIRRPQKDGLQVKIGGIELLDDFYRIFAENMRDLGSPVHAKKFIAAVVNEFADKARIYLVYKEQTVYAASITLACGNTLSNPWASSLRRYSASSPNMLLYWTMLEYACNNGFKQFDFGRSTPGEGTFKFKQQWGAVAEPLNWCCWKKEIKDFKNNKNQLSSPGLRAKIAVCWGRLPLPVANTLGPLLRKYISL